MADRSKPGAAHRGDGQGAGATAAGVSGLCVRRERWCAPGMATRVRRAIDADGWARERRLVTGARPCCRRRARRCLRRSIPRSAIAVRKAASGARLDEAEIVRLFAARDADYEHVVTAADALRQAVSGETVRYVVNRNINYTNICYFAASSAPFPRARRTRSCAARPTTWRWTRWCGGRRRRGIAAPPKCACRAASIPTTPARPISASAARSRRRCRICTCMRFRRWR